LAGVPQITALSGKHKEIIMKKLILLGILTVFCLPLAAHADEKVDMSTVLCKNIESDENLVVVVTWMDGYLSAKTGDMVMDFATLQKNGAAVKQACQENPEAKIMDLFN
jgi:hypothetical protein